MAGVIVEAISSKGCSRLFVGVSASPLKSSESTSSSMPISETKVRTPNGPFSGLTICVTGLSKEARKQVMDATERLGGQYSPSLHPQCTHLVVQSFGGPKFEHALKHGMKNGLLVVMLGWFVDSVRRNVRMSESLYSVKSAGENGLPLRELNRLTGYSKDEPSHCSSIIRQPQLHSYEKESRIRGSVLANECIYVDSNVSTELKRKVFDAMIREGATFLDNWFVGCQASHVVCEGPHVQRYIGHTDNLVTPLWILKTVKEKYVQRLVHLSADLARQVAIILDNTQDKNEWSAHPARVALSELLVCRKNNKSLEERRKIVDLAKVAVRNRRSRRMQSFEATIRPITPSSLLDSINWPVSEPTSSACIYTDTSGIEDVTEEHTSLFLDARADGKDFDASFSNSTRPLKESEKRDVIFKNHFLTILFPIDRFGELGPSSRTFFSEGGFTRLQVLDHIYHFYQVNMSAEEIDVAIHTDSKHADRLRSLYANKDLMDCSSVPLKRIDFLGSRRSFEALKRVSGENNRNVYELLIRA